MAFETGVATSRSDLVTKIVNFLTVDAGWTLVQANWQSAYDVLQSVGGTYYYIGAFDPVYNGDRLAIVCSEQFDSGQASPATQVGVARSATVSPLVHHLFFPVTAYWFFAGDDYFHYCLEVVPGEFVHGHTGVLKKYGTFNGGLYAMGMGWHPTEANNAYASDPGWGENVWPWFNTWLDDGPGWSSRGCVTNHESGSPTTKALGYDQLVNLQYAGVLAGTVVQGYNGNTTGLRAYLPNATMGSNQVVNFASRGVVLPIHVEIRETGGKRYKIGEPHDMGSINVSYYQGKTVETIGSDQWYIFPVRKYGVSIANNTLGSYRAGFAYKRVD